MLSDPHYPYDARPARVQLRRIDAKLEVVSGVREELLHLKSMVANVRRSRCRICDDALRDSSVASTRMEY